MIYNVQQIIQDARIALDQNTTSEQLIESEDMETLSLEEIIHSKIEDAVRRVENAAPVHLLESGHNFGDAIYWNNNGCGWVLLPDDFMRFVSFRMSDWERTVYTVLSVNEPSYALQSSRYGGIRGNVQKPVCALARRPEGMALEFFSCRNNEARIVQAIYLPYPHIDPDGGIDICEPCYTAVIYTLASLVLTVFGDADKASALSALAQSILEQ